MNEQISNELELDKSVSILPVEDRIAKLEKIVYDQNEVMKALAEKISIMSKKLERLDIYALENRHYIENHEHVNNSK